jgi:hypothetical protein
LDYTLSVSVSETKWQIFRPHEDTRVTWWLGGQTILATQLTTANKIPSRLPRLTVRNGWIAFRTVSEA